jgi:hypothetical protein
MWKKAISPRSELGDAIPEPGKRRSFFRSVFFRCNGKGGGSGAESSALKMQNRIFRFLGRRTKIILRTKNHRYLKGFRANLSTKDVASNTAIKKEISPLCVPTHEGNG